MSSHNTSVGDHTMINRTDPPYERDSNNVTSTLTKDPLISLTVPAIMFASGVIGNLLAILVLARSSRDHKQTVFYRLVGALAITDLFGTCATSPVTLAVYANNLEWVGGHHLCHYEGFMFVFVSCTTIFIIGSMAIDRVLAVSRPFFYERQLTYSRAKFYILALWGVAALMGSLPLFGLGEIVNQFPGTWCFFTFTSENVTNQIYAYSYACIGLIVICVTGVANLIVTSVLLKMRRVTSRTMGSIKRSNSELQMMVLMLGVIIVFATCWCPFLIRIMINQVNFCQVDVRADLHALRLASLNQILDPWVYILFRREFFKKIINFIKQKCSAESAYRPKHLIDPKTSQSTRSGSSLTETRRTASTLVSEDDASGQILSNNIHGDIYDVGDSNNTATPNTQLNECLARSQSNTDLTYHEETELLLHSHSHAHHHGLGLRHQACLFCLSNFPRHAVHSNAENTRSDGELNADCGHDMHRLSVVGHTEKRKSIHISLEDLGVA